jgi:predicted transcriptional regulator YheO
MNKSLPVALLFLSILHFTSTQSPDLNKNTLDQVRVDLKSKLATDGLIYKPNTTLVNAKNSQPSFVKSSRLHSNQFTNVTSSQSYFSIHNSTHALHTSSNLTRADLCASLKQCANTPATPGQCSVNLNQILYLTRPSSSVDGYFSQIKLVKIDLLVADFDSDYLQFNSSSNYDFKISQLQLNRSQSQQMPIGFVNGSSVKNADLNTLIRYYLEFKSENRTFKLLDMIKIDEISGLVSLSLANKNELVSMLSSTNDQIEFYVNARMQCSSNQTPLFNKTRVTLTLVTNEASYLPQQLNETRLTAPAAALRANLTSLMATRPLRITDTNSQCIKLNKQDLATSDNSTLIALAQLQIENTATGNYFTDPSELYFVLDEIRPPCGVDRGDASLKLEVQYLVDNIYVVYLVKQSSRAAAYLDLFLNSVFRVNLRVYRASDKSTLLKETHLFLCVDDDERTDSLATAEKSDLFYELSLLQFNPSLYRIEPNQATTIVLDKLDTAATSQENIKYFVDFNNNNNDEFDSKLISVRQVSSNSTRDLIELTVRANSSSNTPPINNEVERIENLQHELILVAYDATVASRLNINAQSVYDYLKSIALQRNTFLHFTAKVIVSTNDERYNRVNDSMVTVSTASPFNYTFNVIPHQLMNNSVLGFLPDLTKLDLSEKRLLSYDRNLIQNYYYDLADEAHRQCYRLDKYDGTLYLIDAHLFAASNCSRRVSVSLEHNQLENRVERFAEILIQEASTALRRASSPVNLVYNLNEKLLLANPNNTVTTAAARVLINNDDIYFQLGFDLNNRTAVAALPEFIKLANFVSNFGAVSPGRFELSSVEYKTHFESGDLPELVIDSKQNALYLNTTRLMTHGSKLSDTSCMPVSLAAKNYIYLNSVKRKLISSDLFSLNLCFLNGGSSSEPQQQLVTPIFDMSSSFQYLLLKRTAEQNLFYLFKNDLLSIVWYVVIGLFALGSAFLVSVLVYLNFSKKINDLSSQQINSSQYSSQNNFKSMMKTICRGSNNQGHQTSVSSFGSASPSSSGQSGSSSGFGRGNQLRIRNDLSVNSNLSQQRQHYQHGEMFQIRCTNNQSCSAYDLNQVDGGCGGEVIVPSKLDIMLNKRPLNLAEDMIFSFRKENESISEDQGVYCVPTGLSSSASSPATESNISSVTSNQANFKAPLASTNGTDKLSLFDMTPVLTVNQAASRFINKSLCKNKLMLSPTCANNVINEDMRTWVLANYSINCSSAVGRSNFNAVCSVEDECII